MLYKSIVRPWFLFKGVKEVDGMDLEPVHNRALAELEKLKNYPRLMRTISWWSCVRDPALEVKLWGLTFPNPVGVAAGLDKYARVFVPLSAFRPGFIEIGGFTREEQEGNQRPRMFWFPTDRAMINRMGFNNCGLAVAQRVLMRDYWETTIPIGINMGKGKNTPLAKAAEEYRIIFERLWFVGSYFVVNVSSPNTPGLRKLQDRGFLVEILASLREANSSLAIRFGKEERPILVKISPDLTEGQLDDLLSVVIDSGIAGIIATNTTTSREGLSIPTTEEGGLSGPPLRARSTQIVRYLAQQLRSAKKEQDVVIIGVGGISSAEDAYEKIRAGASLVQLYNALFYEGPGVFRNINRGLVKLLRRDGLTHISQAVGADL